jgi:hypothetical protein
MERIIKNFKTWTNLNEGVGAGIVAALDKFFAKTTTAKLATKLEATSLKQLNDLFGALAMSGEKNFIKNASTGVITAIKSSTGVPIPVSQLEKVLTAVIDGTMKVDELAKLLPAKLADGTPFSELTINVIKKATQSAVIHLKPNPPWIYKWFSKDKSKMIANLFEKIKKLENIPFNPKNVKIISQDVLDSIEGGGQFRQRPTLEIQVAETGDNFLIYSSTGTGAPELKQAGDWQLLAGYMPYLNDIKKIEWYLKDEATTQLTKGLNKWATALDNFIKKNGVDALGK